MKYIIQLGFILLVFCAIASGILAFVNSKTQPVIAARKALEEEQTRQEMMPDAKSFDQKIASDDSTFVYYIAKNENGEVIGYSFVAARRGYSSIVKTMVALDKDFNIITIKVIDQNETPGLGSLSQEKSFPERFKGKTLDQLKVDKDGGSIKSITGATITTRAITSSVHDGIKLIMEELTLLNKSQNQTLIDQETLSPRELKAQKIRQELLPQATQFEKRVSSTDTSFVYYIAKNEEGKQIGYVLYGSGQGYASLINTICCLDNDFNVVNMRVLKQDETPGLGTLCMEPSFAERYKGKKPSDLKISSDGGEIETILGATITTRAVTKCLSSAVEKLQSDLKSSSAGGSR